MRRNYPIYSNQVGETPNAKRQRKLVAMGLAREHPFLPTDVLMIILNMLPNDFHCVWRCVSKLLRDKFPMGKWNRTTAMLRFTSDPACQDLVIFAVRNWRWSVAVKGESENGAWTRIANAGSFKLLSLFAKHSSFVCLDGTCKLPLSVRCEILQQTLPRANVDDTLIKSMLGDAMWKGDVDTIEWLLERAGEAFLFDSSHVQRCLNNGLLSVYRHYYESGRIITDLASYAYGSLRQGALKDYYWARSLLAQRSEAVSQVELGKALLSSGHIWLADGDGELSAAILAACADRSACLSSFLAAQDRENYGVLSIIFRQRSSVSDKAALFDNAQHHANSALMVKFILRHGAPRTILQVAGTRLCTLAHPDNIELAHYLEALKHARAARVAGALMALEYAFKTLNHTPRAILNILAKPTWVTENSERQAIGKVLVEHRPCAIEYCHSIKLLTSENVLELIERDTGPYRPHSQWIPSKTFYGWCRHNAGRERTSRAAYTGTSRAHHWRDWQDWRARSEP